MRTSKKFVLSMAAGACLGLTASPSPAQTTRAPADRARPLARHFPERPPVQLQILETAEHEPRMIITNLHQSPLTAFLVRTDPTPANSITNTLVFDALTRTGLLAPIPRGLSFVTGLPHIGGRSAPDPVLAAAVWEDGSTFGPDELLARIPKARSALADSYDRAIVMLQTGVDKNWTSGEYSVAAQQLRLPIDPAKPALPESSVADGAPLFNIALNMDRMARDNRPARTLASLVRSRLSPHRLPPPKSSAIGSSRSKRFIPCTASNYAPFPESLPFLPERSM
jgi:hypothetical protein